MDWFLEKANSIITGHFHKIYGFLAASMLLAIFSLIFYSLLPEDILRFRYYFYGVLVFEMVLAVFWLHYTFWIPRNSRSKTGVVICIHADSNDAEQNLRKDFISSIKKNLARTENGEIFNVITIKNHIAEKFNTLDSIKKLQKKTRGHIYIFGETKKRKHGTEQYFLSLDGLVLHRPVALQVSRELSQDFLATLPKSINFQEEFAFAGFRISADIVVNSIEYIIGIASFISGNPFLAIKLHNALKEKIKANTNSLPGDKAILSKLNLLLSEEYALVATYYLHKNDRDKTKENLNAAMDLNQKCYRGLLTEAYIAFSWDNDATKALKTTKKCHDVTDPTWRYNEAFLRFWLGHYPTAWKQCEKIKRQNYSNELEISKEITNFNEQLLKTVTDKPILYFWLGFNYLFKQNNLPLALKSLENFVDKADKSMKDQKNKATSWVKDIKKEANWK